MEQINEIEKNLAKIDAEGARTDKIDARADELIRGNLENISRALKASKPGQKKTLMKSLARAGLAENFNADGSIKDISVNNNYKKSSYSASMRGKEAVIASDLNTLTDNMVNEYAKAHNVSVDEARAEVGEVKVLESELSETASKNLTKMKKAVNALNERGGQRLSFVVVEPNNQFNGVIKGDVMYIGADTLESGKFAGTLVHEYTHFEEGSKEYKKLIKYLAEDSSLFIEARDNVVGTDAGYGLDAEALASVQDKITKGEQLTADEALAYGTYQTEVAAHMSEAMLGSEAFIDKLVKQDSSLADKVVSRMQSIKETLSTIGDAEARAELSRIRKAERLYLKAAEKAGNKELTRRLRGYIDEDKEANSQTSENLETDERDADSEQSSDTERTDGQKENAPESESAVQYKKKGRHTDNETDSIRQQLREHIDEINQMDPVADIKYNVVNREKSRTDAISFYKTKGFKIDRQNFGTIELGVNEAKESSNYLNEPAEFAAWMTIPSVLKRGKLFSGHDNHKNEGFPTFTIAAPVVINGKRGNVAAVVKQTGKYRYKTHRILMPDGSAFIYEPINENAEPTGSDILLNEKEKGPDISSASANIIPDSKQKSNTFSENSSKNSESGAETDSGAQFSRKKTSDTITMSRGEAAKRNANYESDVIFDKKDIVDGLNSVDTFGKLPADIRNDYIEEVWRLFNTFIDGSRREMYIDMVSKRLYVDLVKNGDFATEENRSKIKALKKLIKKLKSKAEKKATSLERKTVKQKEKAADFSAIEEYFSFLKGESELADFADVKAKPIEVKHKRTLSAIEEGYNEAIKAIEDGYIAEVTPLEEALKELERNSSAVNSLSAEELNNIESSFKEALGKIANEAAKPSLRSRMANEIRGEILSDFFGNITTIEALKKEKNKLDKEYQEYRIRVGATETLFDAVSKLENFKKGRFVNAVNLKNDTFKKSIEQLTKVRWRGHLVKSNIREKARVFKEWYDTLGKEFFSEPDSFAKDLYCEYILNYLDIICEGEGDLSNREIIMLAENGNNESPLYAVLSFYNNTPINGSFAQKPHIVLTVAEKEITGTENRSGWIETINTAIEENRVLDYNKKERSIPSVIAQHARLGNITEASLDNSLSRFKKKVNVFREKNKISYSRKKSSDTITMSRGEAAKRNANYESGEFAVQRINGIFAKGEDTHALRLQASLTRLCGVCEPNPLRGCGFKSSYLTQKGKTSSNERLLEVFGVRYGIRTHGLQGHNLAL